MITEQPPVPVPDESLPVSAPSAFWFELSWARPDELQYEIDARLAAHGEISAVQDGPLIGVCFGTFLDCGAPGKEAETLVTTYRCERTLHWLAEVSGDYAVLVYDRDRRQVHLARNHAGTRPIFYRTQGTTLRVGSDFRSTGSDGRTVDTEVVARMLAHEPLRPGTCLPSDVKTVAPAHVDIISPGGVVVHERYWDPRHCPPLPYKTLKDAVPALAELFGEVVGQAATARPDQPGVHLTGGLDSAVVTAWATKSRTDRGLAAPMAFAWQPPVDNSPSPATDKAADTNVAASGDQNEKPKPNIPIDQHLINLMINEFGIECRRRAADLDATRHVFALDPAAAPVTSTLLADYAVMVDAERLGIHRVMSGWGGDELISFNGRHLPMEGPSPVATDAHRQAIRYVLRQTRRIRRKSRHLARRSRQTLFGNSGQPFAVDLDEPRLPYGFAAKWMHDLWEPRDNSHLKTARDYQIAQLEQGHLHERTDSWSVFGTQFGIQYSYPLLDRRIVEFALGLPDECFPRGRTLMREAMRGMVPDEVRDNPDKSDPGRIRHTFDMFHQILGAERSNLPIKPERLRFLDGPAVVQALDDRDQFRYLPELLEVMTLAYDPDGVPLAQLVGDAENLDATTSVFDDNGTTNDSRWRRAAHRLRSASWRRKALYIAAVPALVLADLAVRLLPLRFVLNGTGDATTVPAGVYHPRDISRAHQVGKAVAFASRVLPHHPLCLPQAVTVQRILKAMRIPSTVHLGVTFNPQPETDSPPADDEQAKAHAWVKVGDHVVAGAQGYEPFIEVGVFEL